MESDFSSPTQDEKSSRRYVARLSIISRDSVVQWGKRMVVSGTVLHSTLHQLQSLLLFLWQAFYSFSGVFSFLYLIIGNLPLEREREVETWSGWAVVARCNRRRSYAIRIRTRDSCQQQQQQGLALVKARKYRQLIPSSSLKLRPSYDCNWCVYWVLTKPLWVHNLIDLLAGRQAGRKEGREQRVECLCLWLLTANLWATIKMRRWQQTPHSFCLFTTIYCQALVSCIITDINSCVCVRVQTSNLKKRKTKEKTIKRRRRKIYRLIGNCICIIYKNVVVEKKKKYRQTFFQHCSSIFMDQNNIRSFSSSPSSWSVRVLGCWRVCVYIIYMIYCVQYS